MSIVRPLGRLLLARGIGTTPCTAGIQELFETPLKEGETRTAGGASVVVMYRCINSKGLSFTDFVWGGIQAGVGGLPSYAASRGTICTSSGKML